MNYNTYILQSNNREQTTSITKKQRETYINYGTLFTKLIIATIVIVSFYTIIQRKNTSNDNITYNSFVETNNTYTLPSGLTCSVRAIKRSVSLYDYEFDLNESRREIKVMDKNYVNQMEEQLKTVMST